MTRVKVSAVMNMKLVALASWMMVVSALVGGGCVTSTVIYLRDRDAGMMDAMEEIGKGTELRVLSRDGSVVSGRLMRLSNGMLVLLGDGADSLSVPMEGVVEVRERLDGVGVTHVVAAAVTVAFVTVVLLALSGTSLGTTP